MKKEERKLLIEDLTARISYGVICKLDGIKGTNLLTKVEFNNTGDVEFSFLWKVVFKGHRNEYVCSVEDFKPYLRPMSSMTEEEKLYLKLNYGFELHGDVLSNLHIIKGGGYYEREGEYVEPTEDRQYTHITIDTVSELIKWLNKHHFDYRGLIEKGLALEAPDGMYNIK